MTSFKIKNGERYILRKTALLFLVVSGILIFVDQVSLYLGLAGWQRVLDDVSGGLIAASIFHWYERRRMKKLAQTLRTIDLTNHHIRNALQPLMFVTMEAGAKAQMKVVEDCVRHVDWTLREVLPDLSNRTFPLHNGGFGGARRQPIASGRDWPSRSKSSSGPERRSASFFNHWIDSWKTRNTGARR